MTGRHRLPSYTVFSSLVGSRNLKKNIKPGVQKSSLLGSFMWCSEMAEPLLEWVCLLLQGSSGRGLHHALSIACVG